MNHKYFNATHNMIFKQLNLSFFILVILTISSTGLCKIKPKSYEKYLTNVLDHMIKQKGLDALNHLKSKCHSSAATFFSIDEVISPENINNINLPNKLDIIINLLNYKFVEVFKTFTDNLYSLVDKCLNYFNNQTPQFISCACSILNIVVNSNDMFEKLYNVMTYFSYIDMRILFNNKTKFSIPAVDEIYTFHKYVSLKIIRTPQIIDAINSMEKEIVFPEILDIRNFISNEAKMTYENLLQKLSCVILDPEKTINYNLDITQNYEKEGNGNVEFFQYAQQNMSLFYENIITSLYYNLGFDEILNPCSLK